MAADEENEESRDAAYAATLDQLATLKLTNVSLLICMQVHMPACRLCLLFLLPAMLSSILPFSCAQGEVQEAQSLFKELASLRANQIKQEAARAQAAGVCSEFQLSTAFASRISTASEKSCGHGPFQAQGQASWSHGEQTAAQQPEQQPSTKSAADGQQHEDQQQQDNESADGDDEWETKDWDHALESIRPPAPPANKPYRSAPLQKTRSPTAAEVLATKVSSKERKGPKGCEAKGEEPEAVPHFEELHPGGE
eukprot:298455-Pelagomonas_calceolata.AAC.3